jgi:hypothetical protein
LARFEREGAALTVATLDRPRTPQERAEGHLAVDRPGIISAAALAATELPEPRWAVQGIIPEGLTLAVGKPKSGKSWLALGMALAVASGGRALGHVQVDAGDVLYLALEDNLRRLQRRLAAMRIEAPPRLDLAIAWPRSDQGGIEHIEGWLRDHPNARLVMVDTLARIRPVVRDTGYLPDYAALEPLQQLAGQHAVGTLVIHHQRKLLAEDWIDTVSGTLGLAAAPDGLLGLFRERGSSSAVLKVTGRDVEEIELGLRWDELTCSWVLVGEAWKVALNKARLEVVDLLKQAKAPLTPTAAAPLLGKTVNATKVLLFRMSVDHQLAVVNGAYSLPSGLNGAGPGLTSTAQSALPLQ